MPLLDRVRPLIGAMARIQGLEYAERGAVEFDSASPDAVAANVDDRRYPVFVSVRRSEDTLLVTCDCAFHRERQVTCKHIAAVLLLAEAGGWLGGDGRTPTRLVPAPPAPPPESEPWRDALQGLRRLAAATAPVPRRAWPKDRQILYVLGIGLPARNGEAPPLVIGIWGRDRRQNGEYGRPKALRCPLSEVRAAGEDQALLALLIGSSKRSRPDDGEPWILDDFVLAPGIAPELVARMCATGRCHLRGLVSGTGPALAWDDGGAWRPVVEIEVEPPPAAGGGYVVRSGLERDGKRLPLGPPVRILVPTLVITETHAARFDDAGSLPWVAVLGGGALRVPAAGREALLEALAACPPASTPELPDELRLERVAVAPLACLRITKPEARRWKAPHLEARLSFEYDGVKVEDEAARTVWKKGERRLLLRDPAAEEAALGRVLAQGLKHAPGDQRLLHFAPKHLARVVTALTAQGFRVEADGKLFRSPGAVRMSVRTGIDWFDLEGGVDFGGAALSLPDLLAAVRRGDKTVVLDDGSIGMLPDEWLARYGVLAAASGTEGRALRFRRTQAGLLDALLATLPESSPDEAFRRLRAELQGFTGLAPADPGAEFAGALRSYQREGLAWLRFLERTGFGGCLADDMGLGKTVQVLAHLAGRERRGPSLVVAPRSLVFHWQAEAARFAPGLAVLDHSLPGRAVDAAGFARHDLVLTTYGTLRRDVAWLREVDFDYCILDEAQAAKNADSDTAKAVRLVRARHRLALSGTPVENHLGELWSLFEFLNPGMLGQMKVFRRTAGELRDPDGETRDLLRRALRPFALRRTKEAVASDLPDKLEDTMWCDLEGEQKRLYQELRDYYRATLLGRAGAAGIRSAKLQVLEAILRLRQAACHPGLLDPARAAAPSAKLELLLPRLQEVIQEGHKALVFSQFTSLLALVRRAIDPLGFRYEYLDGQTRDRAERVRRFQEEPSCSLFLISLKAGGVGLNLTAADYVFLLDPWWNPAVEAQAIDRTHRIGQTRPVFAYRLIARGTIEERVVELQRSKRALADAILGADEGPIAGLTAEDLERLLA